MKLLHAVLAATALLGLSTLRADEISPINTEITSATLEMWTDPDGAKDSHAIFTGNVVVIGTNLKMTCDRLTIVAVNSDDIRTKTADKTQQIQKFKSLLATGKVRIIQGDLTTGREAHSERAEILPRDDKIILTGEPVIIDHDTQVTAIGQKIILMKGESRITGEHVKFTAPPVKDLGFDKSKPKPTEPAKEPAAK